MRVLLVASECNPDWPSLPVVGYKACRSIADHAEAVVATHIRNREAIGRSGFGRATVEYIDNEYVARPVHKAATWLRGGSSVAWTINTASIYPSTIAFEWEVWKRFRDDLRQRKFDVVHRVTPMSPTTPSLLARLSPVPVVVGPLNGGLRWPPEYTAELRREREWMTHLRGLHRWLPGYRSTYRRAAAILAAFRHTIEDLPPSCRGRVIDFPEVGYDPDLFYAAPRHPEPERVTVLYAGRLVPYKCPEVVVGAFARSEALQRHRLLIVGDGPERPRLEQMVRDNGLTGCVEFLGAKPQAEVAEIMRQSDIFAFPSIRELGAGVVVEAMACGLPCVVVDYGGPGGLIGPDRGVKLPLSGSERLVAGVRESLEALVADGALRRRLGHAALQYVQRLYTWDAKARATIEVYRWVLGLRDKPVFEDLDAAANAAPEPQVTAAARGA